MNAFPWPFRSECRAGQTDAPEPPAHAPVPTHVGNRALDSLPAPGLASGRWASALGEHLSPVTKPTIASLPADATAQVRRDEGTKWRRFGLGLAVRLFGLVLIWLGDGSPSVFRKALVVLGVVLSIRGIAVLRYLLISGFRRVRTPGRPARVGASPGGARLLPSHAGHDSDRARQQPRPTKNGP